MQAVIVEAIRIVVLMVSTGTVRCLTSFGSCSPLLIGPPLVSHRPCIHFSPYLLLHSFTPPGLAISSAASDSSPTSELLLQQMQLLLLPPVLTIQTIERLGAKRQPVRTQPVLSAAQRRDSFLSAAVHSALQLHSHCCTRIGRCFGPLLRSHSLPLLLVFGRSD